MNKRDLRFDFDQYVKEYVKDFSGWDFSYIAERMKMSSMDWSYRAKIIPYLENTEYLLDLGTGGGEFLSVLTPLPNHTFATEGYKPNIPLARQLLAPFGIEVKEVKENLILDFENDYFDLVINRHEEYSPTEVNRIIKKGGYFITQQVGGKDNIEINKILDAELPQDYEGWNLNFITNELETHGFEIIEKMECFPKTRIFDIGALLYYLKAIPWQIENFVLEKYLDPLFDLHTTINEMNYVDVISHRILVIAKK